jgi:hypothetical protein
MGTKGGEPLIPAFSFNYKVYNGKIPQSITAMIARMIHRTRANILPTITGPEGGT